MSKKIFLMFGVLILLTHASNAISQEDPSAWGYFRIHVFVSDDEVFRKLLEEIKEDPLESYTLVVNISDSLNQYFLIGDEKDPAVKMPWNVLSDEVRQKLLMWTRPNKFNLFKQ